jgi:hypothetical protein
VSVRITMDRTALATRMMHEAAADALNRAAEVLLEEANQTVPIEESTLMRSGDTEEASPHDLVASVGYGGLASAYAVRQHEDTTLRHAAGRRAKWLELSFREFSPRFQAWIGGAIRSRMP